MQESRRSGCNHTTGGCAVAQTGNAYWVIVMLELGLNGLWLLAVYEVYSYSSFSTACLFILLLFLLANYGPLLFGYEPAKYSDAIWMMDTPANRLIVASTAIYERTTADRLRLSLSQFPAYGKKRARQYFTFVLAKPFWVEDGQFTFDAHFQVVGERFTSKRQLCDFVSALQSTSFPEKYPPWCFYVIEDYLGKYSVVVTKFYHALMDGISLVNATVHCSDSDCPRQFVRTPKMSTLAKALKYTHAVVSMPYYEIARGLYKPDSNPMLGTELSGQKSIYWTKSHSLSEFKRICKEGGITLNDFLAGPCLRAIARYIELEYGKKCDTFTMYMAYSMRGQPEDGGQLPLSNFFIPLMIPMPSTNTDNLEIACSQVFQRLKASIIPLESDFAFNIAWILPGSVVRWIIISNSSKATFLFSNTPGPMTPLTFSGVKLLQMMPTSPINAKTGVAMTVFSYADEFTVTCYADKAVVKDCEVQ